MEGVTVSHSGTFDSLMRDVQEHDRIVLMGHGCDEGLYDGYNILVGMDFVEVLKSKTVIGIWCHAERFAVKYQVPGLFTGMIISEDQEANMYSVACTEDQLGTSNTMLSIMVNCLLSDVPAEEALLFYTDLNRDCPVRTFNQERLFKVEVSDGVVHSYKVKPDLATP